MMTNVTMAITTMAITTTTTTTTTTMMMMRMRMRRRRTKRRRNSFRDNYKNIPQIASDFSPRPIRYKFELGKNTLIRFAYRMIFAKQTDVHKSVSPLHLSRSLRI